MDRDPQEPKNDILTEVMSGRSGTIIVIVVIIISILAASCAVFAAWRISSVAEAAGAFDSGNNNQSCAPDGNNVNPAPDSGESVTISCQTEPPQTKPPQTEPPQTTPQTEPPQTEPPVPAKKVVCIDAGHGYDDPGTDTEAFGDWSEKDITLDIALRLGAVLEKAGCKVAYTRTDDIIPKDAPLNADGFYLVNTRAREKFLNSLGHVDTFVSVHCDSYEQNPDINGVRIYYYNDNSKNIDVFASDVAAGIKDGLKLTSFTGRTLPVIEGLDKDNAYYVTKCTNIPSVLVETGFVTNEKDVKNMLTEKWRQDMAQGIADGVMIFLGIK
jgi:N-acetylmuramoyl-L-alanine amidase